MILHNNLVNIHTEHDLSWLRFQCLRATLVVSVDTVLAKRGTLGLRLNKALSTINKKTKLFYADIMLIACKPPTSISGGSLETYL